MDIYDWDMEIKKVEEHNKEFYTLNKTYKVRDGKVIIDKDYDHSDKKFSLDEFFKSWSGDWIITRVKIKDTWYKIEKK